MNQEPRVVLEFKKDRTDYRLVYDGATYVMQARSAWDSPDTWQPTIYGFPAFCEYVESTLLSASSDVKDDTRYVAPKLAIYERRNVTPF